MFIFINFTSYFILHKSMLELIVKMIKIIFCILHAKVCKGLKLHKKDSISWDLLQ